MHAGVGERRAENSAQQIHRGKSHHYTGENEATAVGVDLNAGRREKSEGGESKSNCVEMKWVLFNNGNPERRPTFQK